jgi:adenine-specific DNA-methyltransferase
VLRKCEWGKDDYSLNVADLPAAPDLSDDPVAPADATKKNGGKAVPQADLFGGKGGK